MVRVPRSRLLPVVLVLLAAGLLVRGRLWAGQPPSERYPYKSAQFTQFVSDSYGYAGSGSAQEFYQWFDGAARRSPVRFPGYEHITLETLLKGRGSAMAAVRDKEQLATQEQNLGAYLHKLIKNTIPRFSLDRGFEFTNTVKYGERQCFLQAVLIAGLLQEAGRDAGVVMVYRNIKGEPSNNGHAVTLLKLANGRDILVDASEPEPFPDHRGLMVSQDGFRYVEPVFEPRSPRIRAYRLTSGKAQVTPGQVRPLDVQFLRSQFWYYRGERTPGALLSPRKTASGLARSAKNLEQSLRYCPGNPLAAYMLGRVYLLQGKRDQAATTLAQARALYGRYGWTPPGPAQYLAEARKPTPGRAG